MSLKADENSNGLKNTLSTRELGGLNGFNRLNRKLQPEYDGNLRTFSVDVRLTSEASRS